MNGVTRPVTLQVMFYTKGVALPREDGRLLTAAGTMTPPSESAF
jgi:hypothetical protein